MLLHAHYSVRLVAQSGENMDMKKGGGSCELDVLLIALRIIFGLDTKNMPFLQETKIYATNICPLFCHAPRIRRAD